MRFDSRAGQEIRTWILFFVGIVIAVIFAIKGNPLNPWWTLVIGAFTCTAVVVSAVQSIVGGAADAAKRTVEKAAGDGSRDGSKEPNAKALPPLVGYHVFAPVWAFRRRNFSTV